MDIKRNTNEETLSFNAFKEIMRVWIMTNPRTPEDDKWNGKEGFDFDGEVRQPIIRLYESIKKWSD